MSAPTSAAIDPNTNVVSETDSIDEEDDSLGEPEAIDEPEACLVALITVYRDLDTLSLFTQAIATSPYAVANALARLFASFCSRDIDGIDEAVTLLNKAGRVDLRPALYIQFFRLLSVDGSSDALAKLASRFSEAELSVVLGLLEVTDVATLSGFDLSVDCFKELYAVFRPEQPAVAKILAAARDYEAMIELGCVQPGSAQNGEFASYLYATVYLLHVHPNNLLPPLTILDYLSTKIVDVNQFGSPVLRKALEALLDTCTAQNLEQTLLIMHRNPEFSQSVLERTSWSPLGIADPEAKVTKFASLEVYQRKLDESSSDETPKKKATVLDLGLACLHAQRRLGRDLTQRDTIRPVVLPFYSRDTLDDDVWSVAADVSGRYVLCATKEGKVFAHDLDTDVLHIVKRLATIGDEHIKAHPKVPGLFATTGNGQLTLIDVTTTPATLVTHDTPKSYSYGDLCWHPTDTNWVFYCNDRSEYIHMFHVHEKRRGNSIGGFKMPFVAITAFEDNTLCLLSTKIHKEPQYLVVVNIKHDHRDIFELPNLGDGIYNTLTGSRWDQRTLLMIVPPNLLLLVDRLGRRPLRVIYGPKQKTCMMKAVFFGPMDKYILASSEEHGLTSRAWLMNRFTGDTVAWLPGTGELVNDVAFVNNPRAQFLVTGADKGYVRYFPFAV